MAVGLSADAFAVAFSGGCSIGEVRLRHIFPIAFMSGFFQALMPVLGWLSGTALRQFICEIDHWIAFGLLVFIGGK